MNSRFINYAAAYGRTPEEQLIYDEEAWPGGRAVGFHLFISTAWDLFDKRERPRIDSFAAQPSRQDLFDAWLPENLAAVRKVVDEEHMKSKAHWNKTATLQDKLVTVINICGYDLKEGGSTVFTLEGFGRHWEIPVGTYQASRSGMAGKHRLYSIRVDGADGEITRLS